MSLRSLSTDEVIKRLRLEPHPEGGFFRETFRDSASTAAGDGERANSTAIYFLLRGGEISRWHAVDAVEIWHWYAGASLQLSIANSDGCGLRHLTVGPDLVAGQQPQAIVPIDHWQQARSLGESDKEWSLCGCTVAPGFQFSGFRLAQDDFEPTT
jgi:uncharacterized protein